MLRCLPGSKAAVDGGVEGADDEEGEEEVERAGDEVVVGARLALNLDLAEVAALKVLQRLQPDWREGPDSIEKDSMIILRLLTLELCQIGVLRIKKSDLLPICTVGGQKCRSF